MKLINKTRIPDILLKEVLLIAKRALHKRINDKIVVFVSTGRHGGGYANSCRRINIKNKIYDVVGGIIHITLNGWVPSDYEVMSICHAESFFKTACHEWGHVYDYQQNLKGKELEFAAPSCGGKRMKHEYRPEEKRVHEYLDEINFNEYYDTIMKLALSINETYKKNL